MSGLFKNKSGSQPKLYPKITNPLKINCSLTQVTLKPSPHWMQLWTVYRPFKKRIRPLTVNLTNKQHCLSTNLNTRRGRITVLIFKIFKANTSSVMGSILIDLPWIEGYCTGGVFKFSGKVLSVLLVVPNAEKEDFLHGSRFSKKEDMWESKFEGTSSFKDLKVYWVTFKRQLAFGFVSTLLSKTPRQVEKVSPTYSRLPYDGESLNTILSVPFLLCVFK